ncbi:MAG: FhaA domain-containing protein [Kofleriaceae bacterium]
MAAIRKESVDQFRIGFAELAKARRGESVLVDPFLIARAIALVMRECTVRSAAGRSILWNEYRMILARKDFELVRSLQGPLEQDLQQVLAQEASARQAELVGALRVTVVFDEADELPAGQGVVRVAFVPTERLVHPRSGEMTVRFDGAVVAGELVARAPQPVHDTVFVEEATGGTGDRCTVQWPGGEARLEAGATVVLGRPHPDAPTRFIALTGAGAKVNKQQCWIALGPSGVRIGRLANANPVHVNGQPVAAAQEIEAALPVEISLSRGDLVLTVRRR